MSYYINLGIEKIDHEKKTLIAHGMKWTLSGFDDLVICPLLNQMSPTDSVSVLKQLVDAGLKVSPYNQHVHALGDYIQQKAESDAKAARDAQQNAERIASMNVTPAQLKAENEELSLARQAEITRARSVAQGYF